MNKRDSLVLNILANVSSTKDSKNKFTAPEETYSAVREKFKETEEELKKYSFGISAFVARGCHKKLTWSPDEGLLVQDIGVTGHRPHWSTESNHALLEVFHLIPTLLDNAHKYAVKTGAINLHLAAQANMSGMDVPLTAAPTSPSRYLDPEKDTPILPTESVDDDDLVEDDEDLYEDLSEDSEEPVEDATLSELGISEFPPMEAEEMILDVPVAPPPAEPVEKKKGRKKK